MDRIPRHKTLPFNDWYLSWKLSYRDVVAVMGERNIVMAHTTVMRWVTLHPGVREALEPVRQNRGRAVADG
jgi:transposase-like protein